MTIIDNDLLREQILKEMNRIEIIDDQSVTELIESHVYKNCLYQSIDEKEKLIIEFFNKFRRLGAIQDLIDDSSITEIMINGYKNIFIEQEGEMIKLDRQIESEEVLEQLIQKMVSRMDRKVNAKYPICDVRLINGSRVNIVLKPIAIDGPYVTIRKFPEKKLNKLDLINNKTISKVAMEYLEELVKTRFNIFISGGTSSGKTTLLNVLSDAIHENERVITIEDSAELQLKRIENLIRLETRIGDAEFTHKIPIKDLIKASLRMRPDRIIVGEVRGDETIDMLQAMNTGHDGSISTGHGNSIYEMLFRLETMVLSGIDIPLIAIRQQIVSAIDVMIHIQKISGKGRRVTEISEITKLEEGLIQLNNLFIYNQEKDILEKTTSTLKNNSKLMWNQIK